MAHDNEHHPEHLAHHFDSMTQQFESGKLGMWLFLATELLMFGGLFTAYSIYRANNPDVYMFAHQALDWKLGGINTVVLLVSSFTMAWGVRAAQLGQRRLLVALLALTFLGGGGFMVIKTVEYNGKYAHGLWVGPANAFYYEQGQFPHEQPGEGEADSRMASAEHYIASHGAEHADDEGRSAATDYETPHALPGPGGFGQVPGRQASGSYEETTGYEQTAEHDPAAHRADIEPVPSPGPAVIQTAADHSSIKVAPVGPVGVVSATEDNPFEVGREIPPYPTFEQLSPLDQKRTHIFFQIYYCMTGLHGLHVLVGMGVLLWLLFKAGDTRTRTWVLPGAVLCVGIYFVFFGVHVGPTWAKVLGIVLLVAAVIWGALRYMRAQQAAVRPGEFGPDYFTPVEIGGLYWHLVDLIWIFLFPLLYLIR